MLMLAPAAIIAAFVVAGTPPRARMADDSALARIRAAYARAYDAGDADAMAEFYSSDAVRMPYDAPAVQGRSAILAAYRSSFHARRFTARLELDALEVITDGSHAAERGTYHEWQIGPTARRREDGKYVVVAVRDAGGWKYQWSIFNRDSVATVVAASAAPPPR